MRPLRLFTAFCAALIPLLAAAQSFPDRPIRLVAPLAAGGVTDMASRLLAERAGRHLGQPMVVENRPGAGGLLGSKFVASAIPDGYTLLMGTIGTLAVSPAMYANMPYDTDRDIVPVSLIAGGQFALVVHPSFPANTFEEFVAHVKANPGKHNYGSAGNGSTLHLGMEMLKRMAGLDITHVPYKGSGPMVVGLAGGEVEIGMPDLPSALPFVQSGRLKLLAVTSRTRASIAPTTPTIAESGLPDFDVVVWLGVMAPAGTPKAVIGRLHDAFSRALAEPDVVSRLSEVDMRILAQGPEAFAPFLRSERERWAAVVKATGARVE